MSEHGHTFTALKPISVVIYLYATFVASEAWTPREAEGRTNMKTPAEGRVCCVHGRLGKSRVRGARSAHESRKQVRQRAFNSRPSDFRKGSGLF